MKIQVLGPGCTSCKKLFELTQEAVKELNWDQKVEYVTDISKIVELGVMESPVLTIDGNPVLTGYVPNIERVKKILLEKKSTDTDNSKAKKCNCKSGCC